MTSGRNTVVVAADRTAFSRWRRPKPDDWIIVRNWDRFQHYKNRQPPWIKNYTGLLQDPDYLQLTPAERALLHGIWLAFAQADGQMRARSLQVLVGMRVGTVQLFSLNHAGWIEFSASKPLAPRALARETETEGTSVSVSTETTAAQELLRRAVDLAADWPGGPSELFGDQLDALERQYRRKLPVSQRERLWLEALKREAH